MSESWPGLPDRRDFLRASGGAIGWTVLAARFPEAARAVAAARRIVAGEEPPSWVFFSEEEGAEVEEISAFIIPTDDTPGAREAGAVYFMDRALTDSLSPLAAGFRAGLADFVERLRRAHPDVTSITELAPPDAIRFLRDVEDTPFFRLCRTLTVFGTLCDPMHGGNRDRTGWEIIGFEYRSAWLPPFGHYDAEAHGEVE